MIDRFTSTPSPSDDASLSGVGGICSCYQPITAAKLHGGGIDISGKSIVVVLGLGLQDGRSGLSPPTVG